jgi:hypothetical protein
MVIRPAFWCLLVLSVVSAACAGGASGSASAPVATGGILPDSATQIADLEQRSFRYFWDSADPSTGLIPDRYPTPTFSSIAAVGFGLTAYTIGVERGYVTRSDAAARTLTVLRFLRDLPQGDAPTGTAGFHGFFYHFLDMKTGLRFKTTELSTIDTALLMAGVLSAKQYYTSSTDATETQIRQIAEALYERVEWDWLADGTGRIAMGWTPDIGIYASKWAGYNEAMILYVLAIGSPTHPSPAAGWTAWASTYDLTWRTEYGQTYLAFPPLFGHQYSHVWIDFNGIQDAYMKAKGSDYFKNSRAATYAQQAYAVANPVGNTGYDGSVFGVTACDGPGAFTLAVNGTTRKFYGYAGRGMGGINTYDDGTLAPTGVLSSIAFAPEIVLPALSALRSRYGDFLYSTYGYLDAFNPTVPDNAPITAGRIVAGRGWVDVDWLGIDEGPIVAMVENYRSGFVWTLMRSDPSILRGLRGAGFTGGWLDTAP